MQGRWKMAWQEAEQDQTGSDGRIRPKQMRQAAKEEAEVMKDLILEREFESEESWR